MIFLLSAIFFYNLIPSSQVRFGEAARNHKAHMPQCRPHSSDQRVRVKVGSSSTRSKSASISSNDHFDNSIQKLWATYLRSIEFPYSGIQNSNPKRSEITFVIPKGCSQPTYFHPSIQSINFHLAELSYPNFLFEFASAQTCCRIKCDHGWHIAQFEIKSKLLLSQRNSQQIYLQIRKVRDRFHLCTNGKVEHHLKFMRFYNGNEAPVNIRIEMQLETGTIMAMPFTFPRNYFGSERYKPARG